MVRGTQNRHTRLFSLDSGRQGARWQKSLSASQAQTGKDAPLYADSGLRNGMWLGRTPPGIRGGSNRKAGTA